MAGILFNIFVVLATLLVVLNAQKVAEKMISRPTFIQRGPVDPQRKHSVIIALSKRNMGALEEMIMERSHPDSPQYQDWLTDAQITKIIENPQAAEAVKNWIESNQIEVEWVSHRKDYIRASATFAKWEQLLNAKFYNFEDTTFTLVDKETGKTHGRMSQRSEVYSMPEALKGHVHAIFNTVQVPPSYRKKYHLPANSPVKSFQTNLRADVTAGGTVTVQFLSQYYKIPVTNGSASVTQSVFETSTEYYSTTDLTQFQNTYSLPVQAAQSVGNHSLSKPCPTTNPTIDCYEGNLDIQYIMGVAQKTTSIYWWVDDTTEDPFLAWITAVANQANPPMTNSVSWGEVEQAVSPSVMSSFNNEAQILAGMGVTVTVSSGDDGAPNTSGSTCLCNKDSSSARSPWAGNNTWIGKGYFPSFPATSPFVTAVGATMGPENGKTETVCQSNLGGVITSGGGFSTFFKRPAWQDRNVDLYLKWADTKSKPADGYNREGRGYPDIAMIGVNYQVVVGGSLVGLYGTSCSSPIVSALVSLVNADRLKRGKKSVGFLNPTMYAVGFNNTRGVDNKYGAKFRDITSGVNNCCASSSGKPTCCASGFNATKGWDPLSGLGSVSYPDFLAMFGANIPVLNEQPVQDVTSRLRNRMV